MECLKKIVFVCVVMFSFLPQSSLAVDLIGIYQDALDHDPILAAAKATQQQRGELVPQAYAILLPNSSGTLDASVSRVRGEGIDGSKSRHSHNLRLGLTQALFDLSAWFNVGSAQASVKQAQAEYLAIAQNLMIRVASAYFAVLEAQDNLRFTQAEVKAFSQQLQQARERHKVGVDPITNVYDAQARYDSARAREIDARNAIDNRFEELRVITGKRYSHLATLRGELPLMGPVPEDVTRWETTALEHNFDIKTQEYAVRAAKANIQRAQSGHYPVVDAFMEYDDLFTSKAGSNSIKIDNQEALLGVRLSLNILEGGAVLSRTREARYAWQALLEKLESARRETINALRQNYNNVVTRISQTRANRQAILSSQSSVTSNQEAFKVGTRTILDVLDAQQQLTRAQQAHASSQYAYLNSRLALKEAAGLLTISDLEEINRWLMDAESHQK